jgi:hypothetical protein
VFLNALQEIAHSLPATSGSLALTFHNLAQTPIVYAPVMFGVTVSWQGSAGQLELLFMIGRLQPVTKAVRSPSFRNCVPKHALTR